jgi:hypothetical protein
VRVRIVVREGALLLTFIVHGNDHVALPDWATSTRRDDLWKTTCGEMFLGLPGTEAYTRLNCKFTNTKRKRSGKGRS